MDEKNKFWKGVMTGVLITAFACLVTVGTSLGIYMFGRRAIDNQTEIQAKQENSAAVAGGDINLDLDRISGKLKQLEMLVNEEYLFQEKTSAEDEEAGIYKGYLYGLNDPYASYYTEKELNSFMDDSKGTYTGIGAAVAQNTQTGVSTIIRVYKNTPAEESGLLPGDVIFSVGGEEVTGVDLSLLVNDYIKGEAGTNVEMTVFRESINEYKDLTFTRRKLDIQTVETEMLDDGIGYTLVTEFDTVTETQFKSGIDSLQSQGMKKLIIDLRDNPGGDLEVVSAMVDYVSADGKTIVTIADKNGEEDVRKTEDGHSLDIPIAILVNGNSASASEVFTGALKDYKTATVVGTKTYGKGIVQSLIPLPDGSAVKLTTAHYYTPNKTDIHGKGIEPDVEIELNEELETMVVIPKDVDNQLQKAIEVLMEK